MIWKDKDGSLKPINSMEKDEITRAISVCNRKMQEKLLTAKKADHDMRLFSSKKYQLEDELNSRK